LYYAKGHAVPGLWRVPINGGEEVELISSLEAGYWGYWAVVENGIYYLDTTTKPGIAFFDITTHRITRLFDLENRPARQCRDWPSLRTKGQSFTHNGMRQIVTLFLWRTSDKLSRCGMARPICPGLVELPCPGTQFKETKPVDERRRWHGKTGTWQGFSSRSYSNAIKFPVMNACDLHFYSTIFSPSFH
jgi:hypothetical protein